MSKLLNWAGNYQYSTENIEYPESLLQVQELVKSSGKLKVLGTRHSFNSIADSDVKLVSLERIPREIRIDEANQTVTVSAGVRYGELCGILEESRFALHNLGSLPHISVAGACATATHGSGVKNAILANAVRSVELIKADGTAVTITKADDKEKFYGTIVNLGALGVVTRLSLDLQPTFQVKQYVYESLPLTVLENNLDEIFSIGYSVSLFTDWKTNKINQVWIKSLVDDSPFDGDLIDDLFGATPAAKNVHPIPGMAVENCTQQMGVAGPWYERLPHFRMEFTPSSGEELQSEYFVPLTHADKAIAAINKIRNKISPYIQISELRTIDADKLWMSPCFERPSLAIHFTWIQDWNNVSKVLPLIEEQLHPFNARTHWGKLFTMPPSRIQSLYPKLHDFRKLADEFDPEGKFRNEYLEKYIFGK